MEGNLKITDWAKEERPRERLMDNGPASLTNAELLAILLRTGTGKANVLDLARNLLAGHGNQLYELVRSPVEKMTRIKGIGTTKAVTLCAAFELGRRAQLPVERPSSITSAGEVAQIMIPMLRDLTHETCWVLFFDGGRKLIGKEQISSGGLNATIVDVRMILKKALDKLSCELILVHNHPSGSNKPGRQDKILTQTLKEAARMVDLHLIDHIVIGGNGYFSFAEEGLL
ncbi:MAG: DNA repair protein RadC [Bacteroidales bacterium]|jgi:DNA repair protein RadC|nr:DNA repair protein RadC [Bacteroidales bacterium]